MSEQQQPNTATLHMPVYGHRHNYCAACGETWPCRASGQQTIGMGVTATVDEYGRTALQAAAHIAAQESACARQQATEDALGLVRRLVHVRPWLHHSGTLFTEPWWSCVLCGGISPDMAGHESVIHEGDCIWVEAHRIVAALAPSSASDAKSGPLRGVKGE